MTRRRTSGRPPSPNGASSFHLWWDDRGPFTAVEATLVVERPPATADLYFWALQVGFSTAEGSVGGAHLGLQWNARHPGSTAVNWGGYGRAGGLLEGTPSALPSRPHDPNTRDFPWRPGVSYRLRIEPGSGPGWWRGTVTDVAAGQTTVVRELAGGGDRLTDPVQWSEVFAPCDAPSVVVAWREPRGVTPDGVRVPTRYRIGFQAYRDGGCTNTDVAVGDDAIRQITDVTRRRRDGSTVPTR